MNFEDKDQFNVNETNQEKPENTMSPEEKREDADRWIQHHALDLSDLYIKNINKSLSNEDIKPGTFNRVNGVVLFNIGGKIGALPDNEKVMDMITQSELQNDESVAVPNLNNTEVWGNESERNQNSAFKEWLGVHSKFSN